MNERKIFVLSYFLGRVFFLGFGFSYLLKLTGKDTYICAILGTIFGTGIIYLYGKLKDISLTTIEHFVQQKGRDACEIILKKIHAFSKREDELLPASIYHIEYEPKLIIRGTTAAAKIK